MNENLLKAIDTVGRTKALLHALERIMNEMDVSGEDMEKADDATHILYTAQDTVCDLEVELEKIMLESYKREALQVSEVSRDGGLTDGEE